LPAWKHPVKNSKDFFSHKTSKQTPPSNLPFPANLTLSLILVSHNIQCLGCFSKILVLYFFGIFPLIFSFKIHFTLQKKKCFTLWCKCANYSPHNKTRSIHVKYHTLQLTLTLPSQVHFILHYVLHFFSPNLRCEV